MVSAHRRNQLFRAFPTAAIEELDAGGEEVSLARGMVLLDPGILPSHVYFLEDGLASLVKVMADGKTAEVGSIGIEGAIGISPLVGMDPPEYEVIMQVRGMAWRYPTRAIRDAIENHERVKTLFNRYLSYRETMLAQTSACNRLHTLRQRCCRWLLTMQDSVSSSSYQVTHEFLALMLGVNRPALSLAVEDLQRSGIITYPRGSLTILDRAALEVNACECYAHLRRACEQINRA
jgi:CRP-like cAMP-binding protein